MLSDMLVIFKCLQGQSRGKVSQQKPNEVLLTSNNKATVGISFNPIGLNTSCPVLLPDTLLAWTIMGKHDIIHQTGVGVGVGVEFNAPLDTV